MQASFTIRPAREDDAAAVLRLLEAEGLEAAFDAREFTVVEADGALVGCARLRTFPTGAHELASVAVERAHRRAGLGGRVVRAALARASGRVYALAVAPDFFSTLGFERLPAVPAELREKAEGMCASRANAPMAWEPEGGGTS